jgi:AraC family transcriptional regulator of adaptative response/methylated-DNA-[protein]-cysteine methyltransferase
VRARDRSADGQFWYSVATTGVYCRPSCPSRTANPRNVGLHGSLAEAKATGFRPCKRCNPDGPSADIENAAIVASACRLIEGSEEILSLKCLAQSANLSTSYFHRLFKSVTGLTPRDYAEAHQASRVRDGLARGRTVTEAMYEAGFNSSGRFYEKSRNMLGMTPTQYRAGGSNEDIRFAVGQSSLGAVLVASSKKGVASILIGDDPDELMRDLQDRFPKARLVAGDKEYESMVVDVVDFVETPQIGLNLPLDVRGTAFRRRVWQALQAVPAGHACSYSEIARRIGAPKAVRAVASACAANNIAVAIPCRRVVRNDRALSGYAGGTERKRELVAREATRA